MFNLKKIVEHVDEDGDALKVEVDDLTPEGLAMLTVEALGYDDPQCVYVSPALLREWASKIEEALA